MLLALVAGATPAFAQQPVQFFPRFDFHLAAERLGGDGDNRFAWDADFGGELDVIDYGAGRATFTANYEVVMGNQLRRFDPNQGNYIMAGLLSARVAGFELAGMFYHQSRHLSDRPKVGGDRLEHVRSARCTRFHARALGQWAARADLRRTIEKSFVDYQWELDAEGRGRIELRPRVSVVSTLDARVVGVDGTPRPEHPDRLSRRRRRQI